LFVNNPLISAKRISKSRRFFICVNLNFQINAFSDDWFNLNANFNLQFCLLFQKRGRPKHFFMILLALQFRALSIRQWQFKCQAPFQKSRFFPCVNSNSNFVTRFLTIGLTKIHGILHIYHFVAILPSFKNTEANFNNFACTRRHLQPVLQVTSPSCGVYSTLALKGLKSLIF